MNTQSSGATGQLEVRVLSDLVYFGQNVPIEIRDSNMRLVQSTDRERRFSLPPGLYEVSAVLEDGREHRRFARVEAGSEAEVEIKANEAPMAMTTFSATTKAVKVIDVATGSRAILARNTSGTLLDAALRISNADPAAGQLLDIYGAFLVDERQGEWILEGGNSSDNMPTATIRIGEQRTIISLPVNPLGAPMANTCTVRIEESAAGTRVTVWISPERTVANALQNMVAAGELSSAAHMADEATLLLRDKYSDPAGAVLGALILHKVGRLERLQDWVENLARDFAWLPDGRILLATLLVNQRKEMERAQELMIAASKQRPLYAESFSILLDLLRRWPGKARSAAHQAARDSLAMQSPYVDWNSLCFSTREI